MIRSQNEGVTLQCGFDAFSRLRRINSAVMSCWSWADKKPSCRLSPAMTASNSSSDIALTSESERSMVFNSGIWIFSMMDRTMVYSNE